MWLACRYLLTSASLQPSSKLPHTKDFYRSQLKLDTPLDSSKSKGKKTVAEDFKSLGMCLPSSVGSQPQYRGLSGRLFCHCSPRGLQAESRKWTHVRGSLATVVALDPLLHKTRFTWQVRRRGARHHPGQTCCPSPTPGPSHFHSPTRTWSKSET